MTYSSGRSRRPAQRRAYRSSTRPALTRNSGSRGKIHDRQAHGRIASSASQRQTVVPEIAQTIPRRTASAAISGPDHLDKGRPDSAGSSQASAFTSAISPGGKRPRPTRPWSLIQTRETLG